MLPYDENRYFSPRYAINYFWTLLRDLGDKALTSNDYKKEREAWIVAVILLGVMKGTERIWWLQIPIDDPPDIIAMRIEKNEEKNYNEFQYRMLEVMQITEHTHDEIENEINKKMKNKRYVEKTGLMVYLNRRTNIENIKELSERIVRLNIQVSDIWLLVNTTGVTNDYTIICLKGEPNIISFNIDKELVRHNTTDTLVTVKEKGTSYYIMKDQPMTRFVP